MKTPPVFQGPTRAGGSPVAYKVVGPEECVDLRSAKPLPTVHAGPCDVTANPEQFVKVSKMLMQLFKEKANVPATLGLYRAPSEVALPLSEVASKLELFGLDSGVAEFLIRSSWFRQSFKLSGEHLYMLSIEELSQQLAESLLDVPMP